MLRHLVTATAFLAFPLAAVAQNKPDDSDKPIVITGHRLSDLKRSLQECLARQCPPDQDIAASLALAEEQFVGGAYADARTTLHGSLSRNKGRAKDYPEPVAGLYRADSRIAAHLGAGDDYRFGTFSIVDSLKAGLPADDPRILAAQVEVGDMMARFGRVDEAVQQYHEIAARAHKLGLANVEGSARLRVVALYCSIAEQNEQAKIAYLGQARDAAKSLARDPNPAIKTYANAASLLVARSTAKGGGDDAINALTSLYRQLDGPAIKPALVYQPPLKGLGGPYDGSIKALDWSAINNGTLIGQWADITFWVKPDGSVSDVDVLRGGIGGLSGERKANPKFNPVWTIPLVNQIAGRRYTPLATDANAPGVLRVERYTFTAFQTPTQNSRLLSSGVPRYEMLDLSTDPSPGAPVKGG
jgi:hypothetical protein